MKITRYILATILLLSIAVEISAREKEVDKVYMFGFAASFNDSTVYFTDIQEVRGAYAAKKTKFLVNRDEYSYQLKGYLQEQGNQYPTCITCYSYDRKDVEKKYAKLKKKYADNKARYIIVDLDSTKFQYRPVTPDEGTVIVNPEEAEKEARLSKAKEDKERKNKKVREEKGKDEESGSQR